MKTKLVFILLLLYTVTTYSRDYSDTVRIAAGPWPPFTSKEMVDSGSASKLVTDLFESQDIKVILLFRPWKRAFEEARTGTIDGSILWRKTPERESFFLYSNPVITVEIVFFYNSSKTFDWTNVSDLIEQDLTVGIVNGFKYERHFDFLVSSKALRSEAVATQELNIQKLLEKRIDITPIVKESGYATIANIVKSSEPKIVHHPKPVAFQPLHLILYRGDSKNIARLEKFNRALKEFYQEVKGE